MSYYGKTLYLDFENLPRVDQRFSLGRVLVKGISAKICQGVDHENGIILSTYQLFIFFGKQVE